MNVTILSYNIWGMPWGCKNIHELLLWVFCQSGAEIVCLQEVFSNRHRQIIQEKASAAHWTAYFPDDSCWLGTCLNSFRSGSGLCILVKSTVEVLEEIPFVAFRDVESYIEKLVCKGYFGLFLQKEGISFSIVNTHLISDVTDCSPLRIAHGHGRRLQEKQLIEGATNLKGPILVVGDLNQEEHHYFHRMYPDEDYTFPNTLEQLDHVVCLPREQSCFEVKEVCFFQDVIYSDHIPLKVTVHVKSKFKPD
jgi:endonuclease/exonuclease/phosphatase family metal-dependent hydrolase